jgi:hypothetical protein
MIVQDIATEDASRAFRPAAAAPAPAPTKSVA